MSGVVAVHRWSRSTATVVLVLGSLGAASCGDDGADRPAAASSAPSAGTPVDVRGAVGRAVELVATVSQVLHANAFVISGGQVGEEPVLVTTGSMPVGMEEGATVHLKGRVVADPPGSDPVMNAYKARGPIIEALEVALE